MTEEIELPGGGNGGAGRAPGHPDLMAVQTNVVQDVLIGRLFDAVAERDERANLPDGAQEAIDRAPAVVLGEERAGRLSDDVAALTRRIARLGYLSRIVERERFERARAPMPQLGDRLCARMEEAGEEKGEASVAVAGELARREPGERPEPGDERAATWLVPGPGGHVRHFLAIQSAEVELQRDLPPGRLPPGISRPVELKRCWMYGFLLRCCEEAPAGGRGPEGRT